MLDENRDYLKEYYDILEGEYPSKETDVVLTISFGSSLEHENNIVLNNIKHKIFFIVVNI